MGKRIDLDENAQLVANAICQEKRSQRTVDELIGIAKGMIADGVINSKEADFLTCWLNENMHLSGDVWPINVISQKVYEMLSDGIIDSDERSALFDLLSECVGGRPVAEKISSFSTSLPLDSPPPAIKFEGRSFCLTGCFAMGPRRACEQQILSRGGNIMSSVTRKLDFLVIGSIGSRDWLHSTHGTKIIKAVEYRDNGVGISIICEDHWANYLT